MDKKGKLKKMVYGGKGGPGVFGALGKMAAAPGNAILDAADNVKTAYYQGKMDKANRQFNILRNARNSKGAPQFDSSGKPTPAFMYQGAAEEIKRKGNII